MSAGRNLNRAAKLVYSFHFCPHCHKNYLVYWLFFCCQLFFSDKQSSKRFTCTHNPIFQPCSNRAICATFGCRAILEKFDHAVSVAEHAHYATPPSLLKFVSAPYFSSTHIQVLNFKIEISAARLQIL